MFNNIMKLLKELIKGNFDYFFETISWQFPMWMFFYCHSILLSSDNLELQLSNDSQFSARLANNDDCELLEQLGYEKEVVMSRLADGDKCSIVEKDNELLTVVWGTTKKSFLLYTGPIFDPGERGFYIYAVLTREDHRRKGLATIAR